MSLRCLGEQFDLQKSRLNYLRCHRKSYKTLVIIELAVTFDLVCPFEVGQQIQSVSQNGLNAFLLV